ncbi:MAG TPA: endolytic transglycosylase MltG, partial [Rhizomicrobium sp.]|nr:endolytic transglycosylase MltG [Rhizomicrobium sp.]
MKRFLLILLALLVIGAGSAFWYVSAWTSPGPAATEKVVMIENGAGLSRIAQQLQDAGAISFKQVFQIELRLRGQAGQLKAGEYAIPAHAAMADIAATLIEGKSIQHRLTAAEGLTSDMIWKLVRDDKVLVGDAGPVPEEGTLLPETYLFTRGMTRQKLLAQMAEAQKKFIAERWPGRAPNLPYNTVRQAVILASIVEKETAFADERRRVAAVFVNRLRQGMRLQSDPTIIYGLTKGYPLGRGIRQSELEGATPYNTYAIDGLPPGPIANPGKDALAAVMNPPETNDLYFVAD